MGSHQRFQRFTVRRQNNHRIGRPARASRLPLSASDSSCHGAADSTPVLLSESSLAQTTFVPSRKAESQLPLGGTSNVVMTSAAIPPSTALVAEVKLRRELGKWNLTAIGVNQVIGSAVFILPSQIAAEVGNWSPIAFVLVGFASL